MTASPRVLLGRIAVERGLLTGAQLAEALGEQRAAPGELLGALLVRKGFLQPRDLEALLEEQKKRLADALDLSDPEIEDALLGRLLLKHGLAKESQIFECLRSQAESADAGQKAPRLGEILVRKGYLTPDAFDTAVVLQSRAIFVCPSCSARFSTMGTDPSRRYTCRKCGHALARQERLFAPGETTGAVRIDVPDDAAAVAKDPDRRLADGRYLLIREVGRGGMGVVWKAWQTDLRRYVAVKILAGTQWTDVELKRFSREAQMAASLSHTNIASIYELGADAGRHFIVMEFVDGESLAQTMAPPSSKSTARLLRPLSPRRACEILREAALAVDYAHSKKIIHRDLKPHNIMVQKSDGRVYVMDFGLAKPIRQESVSLSDSIVGTPQYMSPEQARGDGLDRRSDVWALGAVLYHILTGRPPFDGHSPAQTMMAVLADDPSPPRKLNPRLHADLETICLKALDKDRHRRYDSARSLADDLSRYLDGEPISARPLSAREAAWKSIRRRPIQSAVFATLAAAGLLALCAYAAMGLSRRAEVGGFIRNAEKFFFAEKYEEASSECNKALGLDSENDRVRRLKDLCDSNIKNRSTKRQTDVVLYRREADRNFNEKRFDEAARYYDRILVLDPSDEEARERKRKCDAEIGKQKDQQRQLEMEAQALRERDDRQKRRQEDRIKALPAYERARESVETAARMRLRAGEGAAYTITEVRQKYREALTALTDAVKLDETYAEAWYFRGQVHYRLAEYARAEEDFRRAEELLPQGPAVFWSMMTQFALYMLQSHTPYLGEPNRSGPTLPAPLLEAIGKTRKSDNVFHRWCGKALDDYHYGRLDKAREAVETVRPEGRANFFFHFILACIEMRDGKWPEATRQLTSALELEPTSHEALFLRAAFRAAGRDFAGTFVDAGKAIEAAPENYMGYLLRAHIRKGLSEPERLVNEDIERAISLAGPLAAEIRRRIPE